MTEIQRHVNPNLVKCVRRSAARSALFLMGHHPETERMYK